MRAAEMLSLQETADRLGVHYMTVYRYVRTGRLSAVQEGTKWFVDPRDVDEFQGPAHTGGRGPRAATPDALAARLIAGDEAGAWIVLESALAGGSTPATAHLDLLVPALRDIGDRWAQGQVSVADEHRASTVAQRLIGRLGPQFSRRGRTRGTVVLGAAPGERHSLPGAIVADLLRGAGYAVLDTGADTPAASLAETALGADRLVCVLVGATTPDADEPVRAAVTAVRAAGVDAPVLVGGAAIRDEDHAHRLGADGWSGGDGDAVVASVRALSRPSPAD